MRLTANARQRLTDLLGPIGLVKEPDGNSWEEMKEPANGFRWQALCY